MPDDSQLDPEVAELLKLADARPQPPTYALSVEGARQRLEELFADQDVHEVGEVEEFPIQGPGGGIQTRLYLPEESDLATDAGLPGLVFYHGGGWTVGDLDTHDNVCRALVDEAGVAALSVDYRLGPEDPFPAALNDAYAAYEWARDYGAHVGIDPSRVAVGGDSAGGNLAAAVSLYARDERDVGADVTVPDYQLLIYPAVSSKDLHDFESYRENAEGYLLEEESSVWYYDKYVDDPAHRRNAYLAPLLAEDFSGLPPATVVTAGFDPLRDEGQTYAEALAADGVAVEHEHYPGQIHGFVSLTEFVSTAEGSLATMGDHLEAAFS
jgi:acetyl esterase